MSDHMLMISHEPPPETETPGLRLDQISRLGEVDINGSPVLIHGSIAHAAVMHLPLPAEVKRSGRDRDIDVFTRGMTGKLAVEQALREAGGHTPSPLDAGLCGLLLSVGDEVLSVQKDGITLAIEDEGTFGETANYEVVGSDGRVVRSFTPEGLLAVHSLEPHQRVIHRIADRRFEHWCEENGVVLPQPLKQSIAEFHRAYRLKYPHGAVLRRAADIYANTLPESIRKHFRNTTHRFMRRHAGRENPFQ